MQAVAVERHRMVYQIRQAGQDYLIQLLTLRLLALAAVVDTQVVLVALVVEVTHRPGQEPLIRAAVAGAVTTLVALVDQES